MNKILSGIRVVSVEVGIAGPFASMVLADLGAEVIKIEPPEGDSNRALQGAEKGEHFYFLALNRGKKSMALDLSTPSGKQVLLDLVKVSDVLLCNYRAGALARLGADYETVKQTNPRLVYCSMTGFGPSGPYRDRPAYDLMGYAWSGMLSVSGEPGRKPVKPGVPLGDQAAGLYSVIGILAALNERSQTGKGRLVEVALLDTCVALMGMFFSKYFNTGVVPGPTGSAHLAVAPSGIYRTKDGYVALSSCWPRIARVINAEWMIEDPRFKTLPARLANRKELDRILEDHLTQANTDQWVELFAVEDIPGAPVSTVDKAAVDPQILHNNMILTIERAGHPDLRVAGNPVKIPGVTEQYGPPPGLGEHNREVMSHILGYSEERIRQIEDEKKAHARELEDRLHKKK
ncbi:MAG: CoA transferase [Chloroflexi bacterium]|nr:CoA transferase [Chloroflexota bacterium]